MSGQPAFDMSGIFHALLTAKDPPAGEAKFALLAFTTDRELLLVGLVPYTPKAIRFIFTADGRLHFTG